MPTEVTSPVPDLPSPIMDPLPTDHSFSILPDRKQCSLVLDTGVFINQKDFTRLGQTFYTVPEVLTEVRDSKSRRYLESLPVTIRSRSPTIESMNMVINFAKHTGDFSVLSKVDLNIIALVLTLDIEAHQGSTEHLHLMPINSHNGLIADGKKGKKQDKPEITITKVDTTTPTNPNAPITSYPIQTVDEMINELNLNPDRSNINPSSLGDQCDQSSLSHDDTDPSSLSDSDPFDKLLGFGEFDLGQEDEGWIGINELHAHPSFTDLHPSNSQPILTSCLTGDYAMQNVILQMGLHLTNLDGHQIQRLFQWILRCFACFRLCREAKRLFCPTCGNPTLRRIQCIVDPNRGIQLVHPTRQISTRGTKYTIPPPKGGKKAKNMIFSQSEVPHWFSRPRDSTRKGVDDSSTRTRRSFQPIVVGYGRKNPNETRKRFAQK